MLCWMLLVLSSGDGDPNDVLGVREVAKRVCGQSHGRIGIGCARVGTRLALDLVESGAGLLIDLGGRSPRSRSDW